MKNYVIGGLIFLVAALAFGIEPVQRVINEAINRGTLRGVEACMNYSKSELLSQEAVRATCVQSFHYQLYIPDLAAGQAGPLIDQDKVGWGGTLKNKTPDHVTTWIQIAVTIFDADGNQQEIFADTPIWIDPTGEADFQVELPDLKRKQLDGIDFCDNDDKAPKACVSWGIAKVMGLTI